MIIDININIYFSKNPVMYKMLFFFKDHLMNQYDKDF